jgi:hypothetical protein
MVGVSKSFETGRQMGPAFPLKARPIVVEAAILPAQQVRLDIMRSSTGRKASIFSMCIDDLDYDRQIMRKAKDLGGVRWLHGEAVDSWRVALVGCLSERSADVIGRLDIRCSSILEERTA